MSFTQKHDDLLRRLLQKSEPQADSPVGSHLDDDALALFVAGGLPEPQRSAVVNHLSECPECRQITSTLLSLDVEPAAERTPARMVQPAIVTSRTERQQSKFRTNVISAVAAAAILAMVGLWFGHLQQGTVADGRTYRQAEMLLAQADFDGAKDVVEAARRQGVSSDRLLSLESQSVRHLRGTLALSSAGRLTDFGYDVDGTAARGTEAAVGLREAGQLLTQARSESLELLLNRGHLEITAGEPEKAAIDFQRATELAPEQIWGWLGLGLTQFLQQNFAAAEATFRTCLQIEPGNINASINLAMTLQEQDRLLEAIAIWESLQQQNLSPSEKALVERALDILRPK